MTHHGSTISYEEFRKSHLSRTNYIPFAYKERSNALFLPTSIDNVNIGGKYKLILYGVFPNGERGTLIINGIDIYVDILHNEESGIDEFKNQIMAFILSFIEYDEEDKEEPVKEELRNGKPKFGPIRSEIISAKPFKGYSQKDSQYVRIYFNTTFKRKGAISELINAGYVLGSDDTSSYYRVVCRNYQISLSSWIVIPKLIPANKRQGYYLFRDDVYRVNINDIQVYDGNVLENELIRGEKSLTMAWDIETYSPTGGIPMAENDGDRLFMIGITYQWSSEQDPFLRVCLTDVPSGAHSDFLTIICGNERNLIKCFIELTARMNPEFIIGFNDSDYDWKWIMDRAKNYAGMLKYMASKLTALKRQDYTDKDVYDPTGNTPFCLFKKQQIKLDSDLTIYGHYLSVSGLSTIDVRTTFRKLYKNAEFSNLNFYLKENKLPIKKDMPYAELMRIYAEMLGVSDETRESELKVKMAEIADYCVNDAFSCHLLFKKRFILSNARELSALSFTSLSDSFYRADGMRVHNMTISHGQRMGYIFTNKRSGIRQSGKYPGAYVFSPETGLYTSKLSIDERREKHLMLIEQDGEHLEDPNRYSEWATLTETQMDELKELIAEYGANMCPEYEGRVLPKCFIDFLNEPIKRPITGLDFSSLYPSLIMAYNLSPEKILLWENKEEAKKLKQSGVSLHRIDFEFNGEKRRAWTIRHNNDFSGKAFGVYPTCLKRLFDMRATMKAQFFKPIGERLEELKLLDYKNDEKLNEEFQELTFKFNYYNSKQLALKILMNTFYGVTGDQNSPFYILEIAGGITSAGQYNIKLAKDEVERLNCHVHYGDTDSLYISIPERHFADVDKLYYSGKMTRENYWIKMIDLTQFHLKEIQNAVNIMLHNNNGTNFLNMAYEEVLYPVALLAKKKYYGIPHEKKINLHPDKLFIRGLDVKKRGVSPLMRRVCMEIMWNSVNADNYYSLVELVENTINIIFTKQWDIKEFIMTDIYRPAKQNVRVQTFVKRMLVEGKIIKPYERFQYIIAEKYPYRYDYRGRQAPLKVGDKMELYTDDKEVEEVKIDFDYYMHGSINGQFSRLISYYTAFKVAPLGENPEDRKIAEDKTYTNACKYVENYCKKFYKKYDSKGEFYKGIFKMAINLVGEKLEEYRLCDSQLINLLRTDLTGPPFEWMIRKAEMEAKKITNKDKKRNEVFIIDKIGEIKDSNGKSKKGLKLKIGNYLLKRFGNDNSIVKEQFESEKKILAEDYELIANDIRTLYDFHYSLINYVSEKLRAFSKSEELYVNDEIRETIMGMIETSIYSMRLMARRVSKYYVRIINAYTELYREINLYKQFRERIYPNIKAPDNGDDVVAECCMDDTINIH